MRIDLVALIVDEYDPAIAFFTGVLGFDLVEDSPSLTTDGLPKRWVVVRPPGAQTGILLARADDEDQRAAVGDQTAGRVGFSFASTTSTQPTGGCPRPTSRSCASPAPSRTARSRSSWTSPATDGTSWGTSGT